MNWSESLSQAINYIEANIQRDIDVKAVGHAAAISPFYLQRGFNILTGYSLGEYIRCRRLYLAALDIHDGGKVADVAAKYGYSTQESFIKAFRRFHGISPSKIASDLSNIKMFMPIDIKLQVSGGGALDVKIIDVNALDISLILYSISSFVCLLVLNQTFRLRSEARCEPPKSAILSNKVVVFFGVMKLAA